MGKKDPTTDKNFYLDEELEFAVEDLVTDKKYLDEELEPYRFSTRDWVFCFALLTKYLNQASNPHVGNPIAYLPPQPKALLRVLFCGR